MSTLIAVVATWLYFAACLVAFFHPGVVPFAVIVWGGLILIFAWWLHDAVNKRKGNRDAYRAGGLVG